jgi:hypothetical protein
LATGTGGYTITGYTSSGYLTADQTTMTDSLTRVRDVPRTVTESSTFTDAIKLGITRFITTQTVTASDTLGRIYGAVRTASETWSNSFSITRALVATRAITQTLTITELLQAFKGVAGTGIRRIKTVTTTVFGRSSITAIFKRNAKTSA